MIFDRPKSVILISPQAVPFTNRMLPKQFNIFEASTVVKRASIFNCRAYVDDGMKRRLNLS